MTPRERYRQVARLHAACLDRGFLATLGEGFCMLNRPLGTGVGLTPAHRFYQRMGAMVAHEVQVHAGETSTVYVHRL